MARKRLQDFEFPAVTNLSDRIRQEAAGSDADPPATGETTTTPAPATGPVTKPKKKASTVGIPAELAEQLRAEARALCVTTGDVVVLAVEEVVDDLPVLLPPLPPPSHGRLRVRSAGVTRRRQPNHDQPLSIVPIRLDPETWEDIDALIAGSSAASRSHLFTVALQQRYISTKEHSDDGHDG